MDPTTSILLTLALVLGVVVAAYWRGATEDAGEPPSAPPDPELPEAPDVDTDPDQRPDGGDGAVDGDYWRAQHRDGTGGGGEQ